MADSNFFIITDSMRHEIRIKRSVFIGTIFPAKSREFAEEKITELRKKFHDATHNCFAYRVDESTYRYSDDGEPSGSAGKPILAMIEKYQLLQSVLVVTRYFGGIKLGTGGLSRAYGQCAEETIQKIKLRKFVQYHILDIQYPYNFTREVYYLLSKHKGRQISSQFDTTVTSVIKIPIKNQHSFERELLQTGNGQIHIKENKPNARKS